MGFLMLFRAEAPALLFLYAAALRRRRGGKAAGQIAMFMAVALLCLAPWTVRNYVMFGKFVPVTVSAGKNLWIGNNAHATGSQHYDFPNFFTEDLRRDLAQAPANRDYEINYDKVLERFAVQFAVTHPAAEVRLALESWRSSLSSIPVMTRDAGLFTGFHRCSFRFLLCMERGCDERSSCAAHSYSGRFRLLRCRSDGRSLCTATLQDCDRSLFDDLCGQLCLAMGAEAVRTARTLARRSGGPPPEQALTIRRIAHTNSAPRPRRSFPG